MFHGYGYEAITLYQTSGARRPETHALSYSGYARRFMASKEGEMFRDVFAEWIKRGKSYLHTLIKPSVVIISRFFVIHIFPSSVNSFSLVLQIRLTLSTLYAYTWKISRRFKTSNI